MNKEIAIVLVSGGMDSALCLGLAVDAGYEPATLHLNYGQRTQTKELDCYKRLSDHYGVEHRLVVDVSHLAAIGGSSLTDKNIAVPHHAENSADTANVPNSYVPFRNANILAIATSWAEVIGAKHIFIGATQVDFSGYPDCREEFFRAFQDVINTGTKPQTHITIETPIINFTKDDIVRRALELNVPLEMTWSCYQSEDAACGECDSCLLRLKGFRLAGEIDPIPYKK
ncbi:MAG: 7-cyano-7-deazaguanine synthase QueC [Candidatus Kapabacteria bacterium]|jgi:7-cyano-7-deazaguanine synthase|nr:7-cyano-7-deazaguanine synthase QueC [Candidatus Kapabacteria bacterium]